MNNSLDEIKFYSFNKQDFIILLSVYNAGYLISSSILNGHLVACFITAVLLSLITLFVIVWIDLFKKASEEDCELENENKTVMNKIRNEYLKVHQMKRKHELLIKAGCLPSEDSEKTIMVDHPSLSLKKDLREREQEVHFNYIEDIASGGKIRGEPEGA